MTTGTDGLCVGNTGSVPRLNIPSLCLEDGPVGVRAAHGISQFPAGLTSAATWDRDLIYARSKAMGQEFRDQGVHIPVSFCSSFPGTRCSLIFSWRLLRVDVSTSVIPEALILNSCSTRSECSQRTGLGRYIRRSLRVW